MTDRFQEVPCPRCGAPVGQGCVYARSSNRDRAQTRLHPVGMPTRRAHNERITAYRALIAD